MKTITFINPPSPWLISDRVEIPLGLLQLSSYCMTIGWRVSFLDLSGGVWKTQYRIPSTDFYGIGFTTPQYPYAIQIVEKIRSQHPGAKIIAGGPHATALPQEMLHHFDCVVRGEGEPVMQRILEHGIEQPVYGIEYVSQELYERLPYPEWDLVDMESYVSDLGVVGYMGGWRCREINVMASRGCTGHCAYCTMFKGPLRRRNVDSIIGEVKLLNELYGVNRVFFVDDNLVINKPWLRELCERMDLLGMAWHCLGRADQVDEATCRMMARCGCMGIDFGIESGSQRILDLIKKRVAMEVQELGLRAAKAAGIRVRAQMMVGLPDETEFDFTQTRNFVLRNFEFVDKWGFHTFVPFPTCEIYHHPERFNYSLPGTDWSEYVTIGRPGERTFAGGNDAERNERWKNELNAIAGNSAIHVTEAAHAV